MRVYGDFAAATGWTRRDIDLLTLPEVREQYEYWREFPPLHLLVRAFVGYKPPKETSGGAALDELKALAGRSGHGARVTKISDLPDWAKPKLWPMNVN